MLRIPVAALFWGWLVLDERVALSIGPGLGAIIAGVYLAGRPPSALSRRRRLAKV